MAAILVLNLASAGTFAQPGPATVAVVAARSRPVPSTLMLVGSVQPYTRSLIASEVAGLAEALPVEEGDRVAAGTVICRLRDKTRRLAHAEAEATLKRLAEELAELKAGTRAEEIARAKAEMEEARALHQRWLHELERITKLHEEGSASQKEYNDVVADTAAAGQRLAQKTASYELAVAGPRAEEIARAHFAVEAQRTVVARLEYDLDQTQIRAPFAGYVTHKYAEVGQWIEAGGDVVELIDLDRVLVRVDVPESAISAAKVGAPVVVIVDALSQTLRGEIQHVIPQADEKARTFPVEAVLANVSGALKSGMFVRARVPAGPTVESIIVPRDAIIQRFGANFVVMVVPSPEGKGEQAMPAPVQLGADVGSWIAIESPMVQPGTLVAVKGHDRIYAMAGPEPVRSVPATVAQPPPLKAATSQPATAPAVGERASTGLGGTRRSGEAPG